MDFILSTILLIVIGAVVYPVFDLIINKADRERRIIELLEEQNQMLESQNKRIADMLSAIQHIRYMTINELSLSELDKEILDKNVKFYNDDMERIVKELEYERRLMERKMQRLERGKNKRKKKDKDKEKD